MMESSTMIKQIDTKNKQKRLSKQMMELIEDLNDQNEDSLKDYVTLRENSFDLNGKINR